MKDFDYADMVFDEYGNVVEIKPNIIVQAFHFGDELQSNPDPIIHWKGEQMGKSMLNYADIIRPKIRRRKPRWHNSKKRKR